MKLKFFTILILLILAAIGLKKSFAQPLEQYQNHEIGNLIRVGISSNDFSSLEYKEISITSDAGTVLTDETTNTEILKAAPEDVLKFEIAKDSFIIYQNGQKILENIAGPVEISAECDFPLQIVGLKRKGKPAAYRGSFEIVKIPSKSDKFSVINVLPLEEYLRGVVPNELPVSFGLESLKAQAIAARNYAIRPRAKINRLFDVCDSVQSQVYFGKNTENSISDKALEETNGLLSLYEGNPILALYSSTAGGYTESYENAFSEPGSEKFPAKSLPYLKGKPDVEDIPCLSSEENARAFYTSSPSTFDNGSGYFRWTRSWTEEEFRKELNNNLNKFSTSGLITPKFEKGTDIGKIIKIEVLSRGVSGKIIELCITSENGAWSIKKELLIRRILTCQGKALPSANVVFDNYNNENGYLIKLEAFGGGLGHGVGMSQYGAGFMSKNGFSFDKILQHYYDSTSIGTLPVIINQETIPLGIREQFYSDKGKADLIIENNENVDKFNFMINSNKISLNKNYLPQGKIRMPLDNFAVSGLNEIVFYPLETNKGRKLKVWIEVFKAIESDN